MALLFTPDRDAAGADIQTMGSVLALIGTITFSGTYAAGGDTFATGKNLESVFKRIGRGKVLKVFSVRGFDLEWDAAADKLKVYDAAGVEIADGAYPASLTATPPRLVALGI